MTTLNKNVRRVSNTFVRSQGKDRRLVIEIRPGATETIFVREQGRRTGYQIPLTKIYLLGARLEADERRRMKAEKKKQRKTK